MPLYRFFFFNKTYVQHFTDRRFVCCHHHLNCSTINNRLTLAGLLGICLPLNLHLSSTQNFDFKACSCLGHINLLTLSPWVKVCSCFHTFVRVLNTNSIKGSDPGKNCATLRPTRLYLVQCQICWKVGILRITSPAP